MLGDADQTALTLSYSLFTVESCCLFGSMHCEEFGMIPAELSVLALETGHPRGISNIATVVIYLLT